MHQDRTLTDTQENAVAAKNALLYSACAAFSMSVSPIAVALGGLTGSYLLGTDKSLATAPVTGLMVGIALGAMPAALLMQRVGRKYGFMTGAIIGMTGLAVAGWTIVVHDFWLFCAALVMVGISLGFSQQYRFAATDRGTADFHAKAISWVLAGGVAAAIIGPQLVIWSTDLLSPVPFAGAFFSGILLFVACLIVLSFLEPSMPPRSHPAVRRDTGRPLIEIVAQPRFLVALMCGTGSFAVMSFVMTAAPLAMVACGHSQTQSTLGIQWHVMAMFAPSFFTGNLIARFGHERILGTGLLILAICSAVALMGIELANFWSSLILLGIGWNFGFIGATSMITDTYRRQERAKAQGINDLILFSTVAFSSLMSGRVLNSFGWEAVNWSVFPIIAVCLASLFWLSKRPRAGELSA